MALTTKIPDARLYYAMAREHVNDPGMWDDCVQEAAIHVWKLQERGEDHPPAWYHKAARRRIQEVAQRQTWTGFQGHRGYPIDPLRRPHSSLDEIMEHALAKEAIVKGEYEDDSAGEA